MGGRRKQGDAQGADGDREGKLGKRRKAGETSHEMPPPPGSPVRPGEGNPLSMLGTSPSARRSSACSVRGRRPALCHGGGFSVHRPPMHRERGTPAGFAIL